MTSPATSGRLSTTERSTSILLAALMVTQALLGLLASGNYRDVAWIKAAWFGNDLVTLLIAVPLRARPISGIQSPTPERLSSGGGSST